MITQPFQIIEHHIIAFYSIHSDNAILVLLTACENYFLMAWIGPASTFDAGDFCCDLAGGGPGMGSSYCCCLTTLVSTGLFFNCLS